MDVEQPHPCVHDVVWDASSRVEECPELPHVHVGGALWHGYRGEAPVGMQALQLPPKVTHPLVRVCVLDDVVDPLQFCRAEGAVVRRWWRLGGWRGHGLPDLDCSSGR